MKIDMYTKAVLTVIAACLVWICVNGATPVAQAQAAPPPPTPVVLVDVKGVPLTMMPVTVTNPSLSVQVANQAVPVTVTNPALAVALMSIQRGTRWDPMQVQVMREPPTQKPVP